MEKSTASRLRNAGYAVHLIAEHFENDASEIPDEDWIAEGAVREQAVGFWHVYRDGSIRRMWP